MRNTGVRSCCSGSFAAAKKAAAALARALGKHLRRVDLSSIVSKFIGETEKNLSRFFERAEQAHAVLFFDEAEALFGKRSTVSDAHDRYANIGTSYLLRRLEEFKGPVILTLSPSAAIDAAYLRRFAVVVDFVSSASRRAAGSRRV